MSGCAQGSTEFMPGNSSQMICLHKCVKCALRSDLKTVWRIFFSE